MKKVSFKTALLLIAAVFATNRGPAQNYSMDWFTVGGGGGRGTGGTLTMADTVGQPAVGNGVGGNLSLNSGFWGLFGPTPTATYVLAITITPGGAGTVSRDPNTGGYAPGATVTLTAVPTSGWMFTSWSGNASGGDNPLAVIMTANKSITANFQPTLVVTNTNDTGPGSLRQAIADAPLASSHVITFGTGFSGTILLTTGGLSISSDITIVGPGADLLTLDGNGTNRVLTVTGGNVNISGLTIAHGGGGIANTNGTVNLSNCVISRHSGRGLINGDNGRMVLNGCTISSNALSGSAGLILGAGVNNVASSSVLIMTNCTVSGNTLTATGTGRSQGAGINNQGAATVIGCTICKNSVSANNFLAFYGGIYSGNSISLTVGNTIVAGNLGNFYDTSGPDDCRHFSVDLGYNLIGATNDAAGWAASDILGSAATPLDPKLGPLQNNGGTTPTHALLSGSPAIDQGNRFSSFLAVDQRGQPRPFDDPAVANAPGGDASDIGAYEAFRVVPPVLTIRLTATNGVLISWPSPSTGFDLQQNGSLTDSLGWLDFSGAIGDDGITRSVVINPPSGTVFYRLKK